MGDIVQQRRDQPCADDEHQRDKARDLCERKHERLDQHLRLHSRFAIERAGKRRQEHEHQNHGEVLDDQPAHGDTPAFGLDQPPLLQQTQHHYGARHRKGYAEDDPGRWRPALPPAECESERDGKKHLGGSPRDGDAAHRQQVLQRKVKPDAEHEQDDADLA